MATVTTFPIETVEVAFTGTGNLVKATSPTIATPTLTDPVVGTQAAGDSSTKAASTAFVRTEMAKASFSVTKGGTDQTGVADITPTLVTFGTEIYDVGGFFASNAWTPPAGKVCMSAAVFLTGTISAGVGFVIYIYKNGSQFKFVQPNVNIANFAGGGITIEDVASGSDAYTVYTYIDVASSTGTISGLTPNTWFMGHWISP